MKVYKVHIRDLVEALIEIQDAGYAYVDIEIVDSYIIKLTPKPKIKIISDLEELI